MAAYTCEVVPIVDDMANIASETLRVSGDFVVELGVCLCVSCVFVRFMVAEFGGGCGRG